MDSLALLNESLSQQLISLVNSVRSSSSLIRLKPKEEEEADSQQNDGEVLFFFSSIINLTKSGLKCANNAK